jgi:hypothetical protein
MGFLASQQVLLSVSVCYRRLILLFTHNRKLSKIAVAIAGVTVAVPADVAVGLPASDTAAGSQARRYPAWP